MKFSVVLLAVALALVVIPGAEADGNGSKCRKDSHCPSTQLCKNRKCVDKPISTGGSEPAEIGEFCKKDGDCASGRCCGMFGNKKCQECCMNRHCSGTQVCKNNKCEERPSLHDNKCRKDSDCPAGTLCCGFPFFRRCQECCNTNKSLCPQLYGSGPDVCYECHSNQCKKGERQIDTVVEMTEEGPRYSVQVSCELE